MQILSPDEVILTDVEKHMDIVFHLLLDEGNSVLMAANKIEALGLNLDPAFYGWLKDERQ